ncbi:hypothetical protein SAY86_016914 [Trapa natans]|uniref:RING-type domain-containing protein n=1 Tax=Trapa natans TaxID=22666 RepID=A0AAN7M4W3_TRANT|nr:hypothetical protein SAY86_016914 [Trapa natans]
MTVFPLTTILFFISLSSSAIRLISSSLRKAVSALSRCLSDAASSLRGALDASLRQALFGHSGQLSKTLVLTRCHKLESSLYRGGGAAGGEPEPECAVCMSIVEHGDEIREIQCGHLFHGGCLDRWLELNHWSCPLCRRIVAPPGAVSELRTEVLFFKFCDFSSNNREDTWWLR